MSWFGRNNRDHDLIIGTGETERLVHRGDEVRIIEIYMDFHDTPIGEVLRHRPFTLDAWYEGRYPLKDPNQRWELAAGLLTIAGIGVDPDTLRVPHFNVILPAELMGTKRPRRLELSGPQCTWVTVDDFRSMENEAMLRVEEMKRDGMQ